MVFKNILLVVILVFLLGSCENNLNEIELNLKVFNINNLDVNQPNVYINQHTSLLINEYSEYIKNIDPIYSSHEAAFFYQEDFFDTSSLIIIPQLDYPTTTYSIDSFTYDNSNLDIVFTRTYDISRESEFGYLDCINHLVIEVSSKEIASYTYTIEDAQNQFSFHSFVLSHEDNNYLTGVQLHDSYSTFYDIFHKTNVYPFRGETVVDVIHQELFNDYYVFSYYLDDVVGGNFIVLDDLYLQTSPIEKFTFELSLRGSSSSGQLSNCLLVILVDKSISLNEDIAFEIILD